MIFGDIRIGVLQAFPRYSDDDQHLEEMNIDPDRRAGVMRGFQPSGTDSRPADTYSGADPAKPGALIGKKINRTGS